MAKKKNKRNSASTDSPLSSTSQSIDLGFLGNKKLHYIIIFAFGFLLYANTLGHDYTQDDAIVIYDNMYTQDGVSGIPGLLKKDTFFGFFKKEGKTKLVSGGRYRPLTPIMFAVGWEIFGKNPFIGHLWNIIWYGFLGIILYLLLDAMLVNNKPNQTNTMVAFLAAMFFMAHPIHTEVVANIKGRDEIMTLLGSLLAMYMCFKPVVKSKMINAVLIGVVFFLALMSKENAISFLAVIPLGLYLFRKMSIGTVINRTLPLLAATVVFLIIRGSILGMDFGGTPQELMNNPFLKWVDGSYVDFSFGERLSTIIYTLGKYITLLIAPIQLTHDYYPNQIPMMTFGNWQVWASIAVYGVMIYFAIKRFGSRSIPSFSILFFLLTLFIVSNLIFPIGTNMSERFMFMPSVGFSLLLAIMLVKYVFKKFGNPAFAILVVMIFSLFSFKTISRNQVWKNDFTLFQNDVQISTNSAKVRNAAAGSLLDKAAKETDNTKRLEMVDKAIVHLDKALEIHPNYRNAFLLMGNAQYFKENYPKAIENYEEVLRLYPGKEDATNNLAVAYRDYGRYYGEKKGDLKNALNYLKKANQMNPKDTETIRLLGVSSGMGGNHDEAIRYFQAVVDLLPGNAPAIANLSRAYRSAGIMDKALYFEKQAKDIDPEAFNQ